MPDTFDVVVVGARVAGASLACHLARAGLSVALVDRASFPSDTASTHFFQAEGSACLGRLGVLDKVLASGAPWLERLDVFFEGLRVSEAWYTLPTDPGPALCVRRRVLDTALVEAARDAGAHVRQSTRLVDLVRDGDRVTGVRLSAAGRDGSSGGGHRAEVRARLVVGADGTGSTVGALVGARRYHVLANQRFAAWAYFEGATWEGPAAAILFRKDDHFVFGMPTDSGLYLASAVPGLEHLDRFRADPDAGFEKHLRVSEPIAAVLDGATRAGRLHQSSVHPLYFRESAGPGWVLVGDAGHFKDPAGAQGISDALRQSERLAETVVAGFGGNGRDLDADLLAWWRWRDRDAFDVHWFAADLGAAGPMSPVATEMFKRLGSTTEGRRRFIDLLNHRLRPAQVLTPRRMVRATAALLRRGDPPRRAVAADAARIVRTDLARRVLARRPRYEP